MEYRTFKRKKFFYFVDPPYYKQGNNLYDYGEVDHHLLAYIMCNSMNIKKIVITYDNCKKIKDLYKGQRIIENILTYSLNKKRNEKEIMIVSKNLKI
jgi:DNA adenine methylase